MVNTMNKLNNLIQELCPQGVCYEEIGTAVNYEQPTKYIVDSTKYDETYKTPVLTAGQTFILGYTDETQGIYPASKENPVIIFDDFTGAFKWVDFPFKVKSSAMKILTANEEKAMLRYVYHFMGALNFTSDEHKRLWIATYSKFKMPLPPMPIQDEIVRTLDDFTELTEEITEKLTAELTARKKQYEYYRDTLLTFSTHKEEIFGTKWRMLGEVCDIITGGEPPIDCIKGENGDDIHCYPVWGNGKDVYGYSTSYKVNKDAVVISSIGANTGTVYFRKAFFTPIIRLKVVIPKDDAVNTRYLFHALSAMEIKSKSSSVPNMNASEIKSLKIAVPPIERQVKIAETLDNFDTICSDLNISLPAEIEARKKQYEYYRDMLLTFAAADDIILTDRQTDRQTDRT